MAKRKAARARGRKAAPRGGASKKAVRRGAAKKAVRKTARAAARKASRKATARKATRKATARKAPARKAQARKPPAARTSAGGKGAKRAQGAKAKGAKKAKSARSVNTGRTASKTAARKAPIARAAAPKAKPAPRKAAAPPAVVARKAPALDRARRRVEDDDIVMNTPPSSLNLDRSASSARSGRRELRERFDEHTETSPTLTAGDVDADWESASTVGDEAPGGDNPTPDQDIVDDIGLALGVVYQDNEELKGEKKISDRDKHRWELDPASAEDYDDRDK